MTQSWIISTVKDITRNNRHFRDQLIYLIETDRDVFYLGGDVSDRRHGFRWRDVLARKTTAGMIEELETMAAIANVLEAARG